MLTLRNCNSERGVYRLRCAKNRFVIVVLLICLLLQLASSCAKPDIQTRWLVVGNEVRGNAAISPELHRTDASRLQEVTSSGDLKLLYDPVTAGVSVYDASADVYWHALPAFENRFSSVLSVTLVSSGGRYYLNSQDNAVAFGSFTSESLTDGLRVVYRLSDMATVAQAAAASVPADAAFISIPVEYRLSDGRLAVSIDYTQVFVPSDVILDRIDLLPYFGASYAATGDAGDFLLVPDGPGGLVLTETAPSSPFDRTFSASAETVGEDLLPASASVFGMGKTRAGFVAMIYGGAPYSAIRAQKSVSNSDRVNLAYATFTPSQTVFRDDRGYFRDLPTDGISVHYRFLSAPVCSYVDMASACREDMIRSQVLPAVQPAGDTFPLLVSVLASADGKDQLTAYQQVEDLCAVLKGKGISDLVLRLYGAFDGGVMQDADAGIRAQRPLGGKKDLTSLCDALQEMNVPLYFGANLTLAGKHTEPLYLSDGSKCSVPTQLPGAPFFGVGEQKTVQSSDSLQAQVLRLLSGLSAYKHAGCAVTDLHTSVYPDLQFLSSLRESLLSLRAENSLMLSHTGTALLQYADFLSDFPLTTAISEAEDYRTVPFFPAVLHGALPFAGEIVNGDGTYLLSLLKCVEYGAIPQALFVFAEGSPYFYEETMSDIADFCAEAGKTLGDLSGAAIESHEKVQDGLYRTGYSGGTLVYVNYNNYSVNVNSITIPPYSYIRIN